MAYIDLDISFIPSLSALLDLSDVSRTVYLYKLIFETIRKFQRGVSDMDEENTCLLSQDKYVTQHLLIVSKAK